MASWIPSLATLLALGWLPTAMAAPQDVPPALSETGFDATAFDPIDDEIIYSEGYLASHPDQRFRLLGNQARQSGRFTEARGYFLRAARFADKLSQGALAEMHWNGEGGVRDRPLAYAWMDLAAERGARLLLAHRERYWAQLTQSEREQAVREGERIYSEYGDPVAKPRLERKMAAARRNVTGSRAGWIGNLSICLNPSSGECGATVTGDQYYANRYWTPKDYWDWQDRIILTPERSGNVKIGPIEAIPHDSNGQTK